jgi:hypothetical protein
MVHSTNIKNIQAPEKAEKFLLLLRKGFDNSGLLVHNLAPF